MSDTIMYTEPKKTLVEKLVYTLVLFVIFVLVAYPWGFATNFRGCPTNLGRILSTAAFMLLAFLVYTIMNRFKDDDKKKSLRKLAKYAIMGAMMFAFFTSDPVYNLVAKNLGSAFGDVSIDGFCPSGLAVVLHGAVFGLVKFGLMTL